MATTLNTVKTRIKEVLDRLVRKEIISHVLVDDFRQGFIVKNLVLFPVAILTTPSIASRAETNMDNLRTYEFDIQFLVKLDDIADPTEIEEMIEKILNEFDNDPTLKGDQTTGVADGGVEPAVSSPEAHADGGMSFISFFVSLRIKAVNTNVYI